MKILLSTWSFGLRGHAVAWPALREGGSSLDAVEQVCRFIEADAAVDSVGFGGLPDAEGHVSLDASIMLSPARSGAVAAVRRHEHPISLARRVMERTPHLLLADEGADAFADLEGFEAGRLLSAEAERRYRQWKSDRAAPDQSRDGAWDAAMPIDDGGAGRLFAERPEARGRGGRGGHGGHGGHGCGEGHGHDTIGVLAIDGRGVLAGACSTSGTPFKLSGRVGDSPIIGHGLYVDPAHGAAVATGLGELIMGVCGTFLAVECMRRGAAPLEALRTVLERIAAAYEDRPEQQVALLALAPDGRWSAAALREGFRASVTTETRHEAVEPELVLRAG